MTNKKARSIVNSEEETSTLKASIDDIASDDYNLTMTFNEGSDDKKEYSSINGAVSLEAVTSRDNMEKIGSNAEDKVKVMLKRELGFFSAVSLIVSVMIGSGIFISPSSVLQKSGSVGLCLIMWAVCGLISYMGALSFAELGTVVPQSGAEYAFFQAAFSPLHKFFGPLPSFTYIWVCVLLVRPCEVAILVLTFSEYIYTPISNYFEVEYSEINESIIKKLLGLLAIGIITFINFSSVKLYIKVQNMLSSIKIGACLVVIAGGMYYLGQGNTKYLSTGFQGTKANPKDLVLAFFTGLWSFDGWTSVTVVSEEIKSPNKNIPRSISTGVPLVTLLYFLMNVAYMTVLSVDDIVSAPAVGMRFADVAFGSVSFIIPLAVVISTFGCGMSIQFGVSRLCYAAGRRGHMIEVLSYIHMKKLTPAPAVVLQGLLSTVFILIGNVNKLIEFVSFLIWIFYGLAMIALIVMRKTKKHAPRPYKVPLLIPVMLCIMSLSLSMVPLVMSPSPEYLGAVAFIFIGVIVYYILVYKKLHPKFMVKFTHCMQVLFQVLPSES